MLETLPLDENSDDFVFDNQMLAQARYFGFRIGEISCPTRYFAEASSINFRRSVKYGFGVLGTALQFRLARLGLHVPGSCVKTVAGWRTAHRRCRRGSGLPRRWRDELRGAEADVPGIAPNRGRGHRPAGPREARRRT